MERITGFRARFLIGIISLVMVIFAMRLYQLQVIETKGKTDNITTYTTLTRVKAARGDILDRNGNVLVGNRASYDLVLNHYVLTMSDNPNQSLYELVKLCQALGIEYNEHFPVTTAKPFEYTLEEQSSAWQSYFQTFLVSRGNIDSDITAPLLIQRLRDSYGIPEEWTDEEARLVLGLRYELTLRYHTNLPNFIFIEDVDTESLSAIKELSTPGMNVEASTVREYHTEYAAHVLGYVSSMSPEQWEYYSSLKDQEYAMDAVVGQSGLELAFEQDLHGTDGWRVDEVTSDGTVVRSYYETEPKAGNNVEVTIDLNLQIAAEDMLAEVIENARAQEEGEGVTGRDAEGGAVVAMDVRTGQILVCASYPTYDLANLFEDWNEIISQPHSPLINRALESAYAPGSTYKMSMVISAIHSGVITPETEIEDLGVFRTYEDIGFTANCLIWTNQHKTHGHINAVEALCVSCNYFFYELADRIGLSVIDATAKGLGLGEKTGVEIWEEKGYRANIETKQQLYTGHSAQWFQADQIMLGIGQSDNKFTPIQLCSYAATLATQGTRYRATFLNRVVSADYERLIRQGAPEILSTMQISDEAYDTYKAGMIAVTKTGGTAPWFFEAYPFDVCAKTGTSETGTGSDNGAFVCFAPADEPQIAIAVYGEKIGSGGTMAHVAKAITDLFFDIGVVSDTVIGENVLG